MSCPGPFFSLITDDDMGPSSPSSWLFPVHPLAKSEAQEAPAKVRPKCAAAFPVVSSLLRCLGSMRRLEQRL